MRTLNEPCIYLHQFRTVEEAHQIIGAFIARYNVEWLIERSGIALRRKHEPTPRGGRHESR
jgi:hypothetical protein